tara:strand:- start:157 stop:927 length:771 start_codon:yes stop_codon:yes gene_type:complete
MIKKLIQKILFSFGLKIIKLENDFLNKIPIEATEDERKLIKKIRGLSMTGSLRMWALIVAFKNILQNNIEGDFVETGVWKGGNLILIQKLIEKYDIKDKKIIGYDTFEGYPKGSNFDKDFKNVNADDYFLSKDNVENSDSFHSFVSIDDVKKNFDDNSKINNNLILIKGKTQESLLNEKNIPKKISLLRLGTSFYESTKIELEILYPRLQKGGYLIIDDYGFWQGSRKAVDDYFNDKKITLHFIDHTCRIMLKQDE